MNAHPLSHIPIPPNDKLRALALVLMEVVARIDINTKDAKK